jgi:hypothetical protein
MTFFHPISARKPILVTYHSHSQQRHTNKHVQIITHSIKQGYIFNPVIMRAGLDDRMDRTYVTDPRVPSLHFREIAECRRISPRINFFGMLGERYGTSSLPLSLEKNEFQALRGWACVYVAVLCIESGNGICVCVCI